MGRKIQHGRLNGMFEKGVERLERQKISREYKGNEIFKVKLLVDRASQCCIHGSLEKRSFITSCA
jgi:hypothetical protein